MWSKILSSRPLKSWDSSVTFLIISVSLSLKFLKCMMLFKRKKFIQIFILFFFFHIIIQMKDFQNFVSFENFYIGNSLPLNNSKHSASFMCVVAFVFSYWDMREVTFVLHYGNCQKQSQESRQGRVEEVTTCLLETEWQSGKNKVLEFVPMILDQ